MIAIVDTDALLGLAVPHDLHHPKAVFLSEKCRRLAIELVFLPTTLAEFSLLGTSRIGMVQTKRALDRFTKAAQVIIPLTDEITQEALALYYRQTSKEESLFDCYNMVVAKQLSADCIFSFDKGYTKNGFILASDYFKSTNL